MDLRRESANRRRRGTLVALALLLGLLGRRAEPPPEPVRAAPALPPTGAWTSFANGDDVLGLAVDGPVLWSGTRGGGLVRWDTQSADYQQFLHPQDPLPDNTVFDIAIGADGRKWLATGAGLTVLDDAGTSDRGDDRWFTYTRANTAGGLPSDRLRAVALQGDLVWVGGEQSWDPVAEVWVGGGIGRLDTAGTPTTADDQWSAITTFASTYREAPDGSVSLGLVSDNVNDIAVTAEGDLWVATGPHWSLEEAADPEAPPVWVRIHGGLSHLDTKGTPESPADDRWQGNSCEDSQLTVTCDIQAVAIDASGYGWATIQGRGLMFFEADRPTVVDDFTRRIELPHREPGDMALGIAFGPADDPDLANTVWVTRSSGGLSVLDHRGTIALKGDDRWNFDRGDDFTTADGLSRNRLQAIAMGDGTAWLGTGPRYGVAGGVHGLDLDDLTIGERLTTHRAPPTNFITDIDFGESGSRWENRVWIATGSRAQPRFGFGVAVLDTAGSPETDDDQWAHYSRLSTDADGRAPWTGLAGDNVQAVELIGDRVWLGSVESLWNDARGRWDDGGLSVFDGSAWTARGIDNTGGPSAGLTDGSISSLAEGCAGELWVGSGNPFDALGDGLARLTPGASVHQPTQDSWQRYRYPNLASDSTSALSIDCARGELWVASAHHRTLPDGMGGAGGQLLGGGLSRLDIASGSWQRSDSRQGLETYAHNLLRAEAYAVLPNGDGRAWVGTTGTRAMSQAQFVAQRPFWPAPVNLGAGDAWASHVIVRGGMLRALARDAEGRVWAGVSRGGMARESADPIGWRVDRDPAGVYVFASDDLARPPLALPVGSGPVANDISVIAVDPAGDVWIGSEGWGIVRYRPGGEAPTPTPPVTPPSTPTPDPAGPTATPDPSGGTPSDTPTPGATVGPTITPGGGTIEPTPTSRSVPRVLYCPLLLQTRR